ncbi:MAG: hypothetical protein ABIS47_00660, partial [Acidimicrobiales bacterium]
LAERFTQVTPHRLGPVGGKLLGQRPVKAKVGSQLTDVLGPGLGSQGVGRVTGASWTSTKVRTTTPTIVTAA